MSPALKKAIRKLVARVHRYGTVSLDDDDSEWEIVDAVAKIITPKFSVDKFGDDSPWVPLLSLNYPLWEENCATLKYVPFKVDIAGATSYDEEDSIEELEALTRCFEEHAQRCRTKLERMQKKVSVKLNPINEKCITT